MRFVSTCAAVAMGLALAAIAPAQIAAARTVRAGTQDAGGSVGFHLPYTDPNQAGLLTLCNVALQPITHGSITSKPFVWRVVSDVPAPKGYFVKGAKAQMFAYQPRPYTPAGAWSGTVMAAASLYSNRAHPMAQFTPIDEPLTYMTIAFPPIWDHLIELRLYLGAPGIPEYTRGYAAADLQIEGNTWTLVSGGHASCTTGAVVSVETVVGMPGASGTPRATHSAVGGGSASAAPSPGGSRSSGAVGASGPPGASGPSRAATADSSNTGMPGVVIGVGALAAASVGTGGLLWRRRRRAGL